MFKRESRSSMVSILACALLSFLSVRIYGQQPVVPTIEAPAQPESSEQLPDGPHATGNISGIVTDIDNAELVGAQVLLSGDTATAPKTTVTKGDGSFSFTNVPAGNIKLTVTEAGFAPFVQSAILHPEEQLEIPQIELSVATANTDVQVTLSRHEIAQEEMHEEEKQRLLGVLPNFFVTYDWHAPPLSSKQKFELAWKTMIDPTSFVVSGATAGIQQWQNDFSGYGQGTQGYAKRFGASFADGAIGNMLGGAVLPSLLHQDPRYFYKGTGSIRSRALYALAAAVICKGDNGRWQPNYSSVLGDFAAGGISNIYYPSTDRNGAGLTIENGVLGVVGDAVGNVIQEFFFRKITTNTKHQGSTSP